MIVETDRNDQIRAHLEAWLADEEAREPGDRVIAVGWATVELDRAAGELGLAFSIDPARFEPATGSQLLGAHARVARSVLHGNRHLVLLEPSTEGRLAGTLARWGEGPVVVWVIGGPAVRLGPRSSELPGPFGPERLRLNGPIHGPHRLVVGRPDRPEASSPGTIAT